MAKINASFTKSPYVPRFKRNYERGLVKVVGDKEKTWKMQESPAIARIPEAS